MSNNQILESISAEIENKASFENTKEEKIFKDILFLTPLQIKSKEDNKLIIDTIKLLNTLYKASTSPTLKNKIKIFMSELSNKVVEFEKNHRTNEQSNPAEILKSFMDDFGLKPQDLTKELGTVDYVRKILTGQRAISKQGAIRLGEKFKVKPSIFLNLE